MKKCNRHKWGNSAELWWNCVGYIIVFVCKNQQGWCCVVSCWFGTTFFLQLSPSPVPVVGGGWLESWFGKCRVFFLFRLFSLLCFDVQWIRKLTSIKRSIANLVNMKHFENWNAYFYWKTMREIHMDIGFLISFQFYTLWLFCSVNCFLLSVSSKQIMQVCGENVLEFWNKKGTTYLPYSHSESVGISVRKIYSYMVRRSSQNKMFAWVMPFGFCGSMKYTYFKRPKKRPVCLYVLSSRISRASLFSPGFSLLIQFDRPTQQ